jgi:DNA-binding NarL/FixJ family response regulator
VRRRAHPPEVIFLTTFDADEQVLAALRAGASGFVLKDTPPAGNHSDKAASGLRAARIHLG